MTTAMTPTYGLPARRTSDRFGPRLMGVRDGDRGLGLDGVRAPLTVSGSSNAATFLAYVEQVLVPSLREGDVVVFDNLASHFTPGVAEAIERVGVRGVPLPPVQPRPEPDRGDVLEVQGVPPRRRETDQRAPR